MDSLGEKPFVKVAYFFTQLLWYMFSVLAVILSIVLLLGYLGQLPEGWSPVINMPMDSSLVSLNENLAPEQVMLDDVSAGIKFSYLAQNYSEAYLSFSLAAILFLCMFIFGFYQLKRLLELAVDDEIFTRANIRRIKTIALLVFLIDPLAWFYREIIWAKPDFLGGPSVATIHIGLDLNVSYWFMGLLLFVLAAVFEKGYEMYEELKLTV